MMYAVLLLLSSWISLSAAILPGFIQNHIGKRPQQGIELLNHSNANGKRPQPGSVFPMKSFVPREQATPPPIGSNFDAMSQHPLNSVTPDSRGSVFPMKSFIPREAAAPVAPGSIFDVKSQQPLDSGTPGESPGTGTGVRGTIGLAPKPAITQPPPANKVEKQVGDWFMVFRARSENARPVAYSYIHPFGTNEVNALPGCLSTSATEKCNGNYRHSAIDKWNSIGVRRVKFELYKGTVPVAFIIFNGTNTQSTSWFNRKHILSSSWTDIRSRGNFFHFFGRKDEVVNRRFYINKSTSSCKDDEGWVIVVEDKGECPYENNAKYPLFVYSDFSTASLYEDQGKQAEVLAIYVDADNLKLDY